jgi:hypothetical protein
MSGRKFARLTALRSALQQVKTSPMNSSKVIALSLLGIGLVQVAAAPHADDPFRRGPDQRLWKAVPDEVYLQEVGRQIATGQPVTSLAWVNGVLYALTPDGLHQLERDQLRPVAGAPGQIERLVAPDGALWALTQAGLYRLTEGRWIQIDNRRFVDACLHQGAVLAATRDHIYRYENGRLVSIEPPGGYLSTNTSFLLEDGTWVLPRPMNWDHLIRVASYAGSVYGLRPGNLAVFDGDAVDPTSADWGQLPSPITRDLAVIGSRLFVATDRGLGVLRGMAMTPLAGPDGLPYEDTTCLAVGFDQDLWIGTTRGAVRMIGNDFHFFTGQRWLPGDRVLDLTTSPNSVYIATESGLGIIEYQPYTLLKKAAYYERWLAEWGHHRLGFTHKLWWDDARGEWIREITDNDGGYSAHHLVARCFQYAVTGAEPARNAALDGFTALAWLEQITPMNGFPARSIWAVDDVGVKSMHGSGGLPAKWYPTDDGQFEWKGDTSSDEVGAHFYATAIFHDLVARGPERERARQHAARIARHIIDNGWLLRDLDGSPTRWGRWDPGYLQSPYGYYARGLNGLEAQAYVTTAYALDGDPLFHDGLRQLIDWGYPKHSVRQKLTFPPNYVVPWDDRLAFMSYFPLLRYGTDPELRSIYLRSLERSWEIKRIEEHPWYNFLYGILTGNDCEAEAGVRHLREWPLDLVDYSFDHRSRADLHPKPGYTPYAPSSFKPSPRAISPREAGPRKLDQTTLRLTGGTGGRSVTTPNGWLESYWMARYYGLIQAPTVTDPALTSVPQTHRQLGAKPYAGPERPPGIISGLP